MVWVAAPKTTLAFSLQHIYTKVLSQDKYTSQEKSTVKLYNCFEWTQSASNVTPYQNGTTTLPKQTEHVTHVYAHTHNHPEDNLYSDFNLDYKNNSASFPP